MADEGNARGAMKQFWDEHSKDASHEEMMLDSKAAIIGKQEIPEVLSLLPNIKEKDVLELGAGIGRFTGKIAEDAKSVIAIDFIEKFIRKNEEDNGHFKNASFKQADVTELELPESSVDIIFSNWLLMYLTEDEVQNLFTRMLTWLRPGGYLFFRESCFHQSGDKKRSGNNPTMYRSPTMYNAMLSCAVRPLPDGEEVEGYDLLFVKSVETYIQLKNNRNQLCWLLQKQKMSGDSYHGFKTFQEFLDNKQYSRNGILRYEKIFGKDFVSTGGKDTTVEFVNMLDLQSGQRVLDVGCGIGGSAFYMAETHNVSVLGFDLSANMVEIAMERLNERGDSRVQFEVADATKREFEENSYDVVYSRDTILHIEDKLSLFKNFKKYLKAGGKVLISDYCCTGEKWSDNYAEYVKGRGYHLLTVPNYGKVLEDAGFVNVKAIDRTDLFVQSLKKEITYATSIKEEFIKEFSEKDYTDIITGWEDKVVRCGQGDQKWGLFYAEVPKNVTNGTS